MTGVNLRFRRRASGFPANALRGIEVAFSEEQISLMACEGWIWSRTSSYGQTELKEL